MNDNLIDKLDEIGMLYFSNKYPSISEAMAGAKARITLSSSRCLPPVEVPGGRIQKEKRGIRE